MAIVTVAEWKVYRGYPDTRFDATLAVVIPQVQAEMERYCSRMFDSATYESELIDGTGTRVIHTRHWPILSVSEIRVDPGYGQTATVVPASSYRVDTSEDSYGRITLTGDVRGTMLFGGDNGYTYGRSRSPCWTPGYHNIQIDYNAGYSGNTMPDDLKRAAFVLIDNHLAARGASIDVQSAANGAVNKTYRTAAERMAAYEQLIGPFRRVPV